MKAYQKIILVVVFVFVIGIGVLIIGQYAGNNHLPDYPKYSPTNPTNVLTPVELCEKITNIDLKENCFANIKEFDRIKNKEERNYFMAIEYNNTDFCDNITDSDIRFKKSKCYYDVAVKYKNPNLCSKINEKGIKYECYEILGKYENITPDMCEGIGYNGIGCYLRIVEHTGNISLCENVPEYEKEYCMLEAAEVQKNESICEKLNNKDNKGLCYFRLAGAKGDISLCEKAKMYGGGYIDYCYADVAKANNNISICEKIKDKDTMEWCKHRIKYKGYYESHCDEIEKCRFRDECFYNLARKTNNSSYCEKIETSDRYNGFCYSYFAKALENETYCDKIKNIQMKDECYFDIGVMKGDEELCKKIANYNFKLVCLSLTRNPNYCNDVETKSCKVTCLMDVPLKWENPDLCKDNYKGNYDACYFNIALYLYKKNKGEKYYFSYKDVYGRNICYKNVLFDIVNLFNMNTGGD